VASSHISKLLLVLHVSVVDIKVLEIVGCFVVKLALSSNGQKLFTPFDVASFVE